MKKTIVILIISIVAVGLTIGLWTYTRAAGDTISVCVKKSGLVYVIGEGFRRDDCKKNDKLLTWNIQGLKGDKGDKGDTGEQGIQGEKGLSGVIGTDNIAFISQEQNEPIILKTDGTTWLWNPNFKTFLAWPSHNVSIPTSEILQWEVDFFLDKSGNIWRLQGGSTPWINMGKL